MAKTKAASKATKGSSSGKKRKGSSGKGAGDAGMSDLKTSTRNQETVHSDAEKVTDRE